MNRELREILKTCEGKVMIKLCIRTIFGRLSKLNFSVLALGCLLCVLVFIGAGCGPQDQLGRTGAEVNRAHLRSSRINRQQLAEDIDKTLLLDEPSTLSRKRIP